KLQLLGQVRRFTKAAVHTLPANRPGLMRRVADKPAAILPKLARQASLKSDADRPVQPLDMAAKPGGSFARQLTGASHRFLIRLLLHQPNGLPLFLMRVRFVCL